MGEWQSIESAPKDGRLVRLKSENYAPREPFFWQSGRWETTVFAVARTVRGCWDDAVEAPTHWMLHVP